METLNLNTFGIIIEYFALRDIVVMRRLSHWHEDVIDKHQFNIPSDAKTELLFILKNHDSFYEYGNHPCSVLRTNSYMLEISKIKRGICKKIVFHKSNADRDEFRKRFTSSWTQNTFKLMSISELKADLDKYNS